MKALIAYGTRYGATASTSEEIAKVLRQEDFDVDVVNTKKTKISDISEYDLVIVGSGMKIFRWTGEAEGFLKKFQDAFIQKKLAIFVSSAAQATLEYEGKTEEMEKAWQDYLVEKTVKYNLNPIAMAMFGGVWDFNKMGFFFRKTMGPFKLLLEEAGIPQTAPDVYDTRDWDEIRSWATELVDKVRE